MLNESTQRNDLFISHASEDKDSVARPLSKMLRDMGLKVWYDEFNLRIGESLRESIDNGLRNSNYGVVILSKNFFSKNWTKMELDGLISLSVKNETRILPIWHEVNFTDVLNFSPIIAGLVGIRSSVGLDFIASEIHGIVVDKVAISQAANTGLLVDNEASQAQIREIQSKRFRFLLKLYQNRSHRNLKQNNIFEVGEALGYSRETIEDVAKYLEDKGYFEYTMIGPFVAITVYGIDYIEDLIPNSKDVVDIRSARIMVLRELYDVRSNYWGWNMNELAKKLGFSEEQIENIVFYLRANSLIEFPSLGPNIKITTYGIDAVENYGM